MATAAAVVSRSRVKWATPAAAFGSLLFPAGVFAWLLAHPGADPGIVVPRQHFLIVTVVSLLAFGLAVLLAIAAVQIAQDRVLLFCLGLMAMVGIFAVLLIATPSMLTTSA